MKGRKAETKLAEWRESRPASTFTLTRTLATTLPFSTTPRKLLLFTKARG